jgi:deoxyribodipyrimidine photolyase
MKDMANSSTKDPVRSSSGEDAEKNTCVLYVMSRDKRVFDNPVLIAAQKTALQQKIPLGVVYCYEKSQTIDNLAGLKNIERQLENFQVPFIVLIGDKRARLKGMVFHTKPYAVYFDTESDVELDCLTNLQATGNDSGSMQFHPYRWPGKVIPVEELASLIVKA